MPDFLKKLQNAKTRNVVILLAVISVAVVLFGIYHATREEKQDMGGVRLQQVPSGARLTPGAKNLSKEYLKTLLESNQAQTQTALKTGKSSIPVLVDTGMNAGPSSENLEEGSNSCVQQCVSCCQGQQGTTSMMNEWVKQGKMSPEAAAILSKLQDKHVSVSDYAAQLNQLVREGKLTPEQAQKLLEAYRREYQKGESTAPAPGTNTNNLLDKMVSMGGLDPDTAAQLRGLQDQNKTPEEYAAALDRLVKEGKLTPEQAKALLEAYKKDYASKNPAEAGVGTSEKSIVNPSGVPYVDKAIAGLQQSGAISSAVADELQDLKNSGVSAADYAARLSQLVKEGKLSPEAAKKLLAAYQREFGDYKVTATQPQLAQLQKDQQRKAIKQELAVIDSVTAERTKQQEEQMAQEKQAAALAAQQKQQDIQAGIARQAQALIAAWAPSTQVFSGGTGSSGQGGQGGSGARGAGGQASGRTTKLPPLVKAGSIMFAVLDTSINTDQQGPVMATIVSGLFKGGKMLGSVTQTPDQQRVMLKFNTLSLADYPDTIAINAVALNPDTAKTAIASNVDNHYLLRYSALFASNFLAGYADALKSGGTTTVQTSSVVQQGPDLTPKQKMYVALGTVGKKLSDQWTPLFNRPATVTVDAGVGLGILFIENVADFRQK